MSQKNEVTSTHFFATVRRQIENEPDTPENRNLLSLIDLFEESMKKSGVTVVFADVASSTSPRTSAREEPEEDSDSDDINVLFSQLLIELTGAKTLRDMGPVQLSAAMTRICKTVPIAIRAFKDGEYAILKVDVEAQLDMLAQLATSVFTAGSLDCILKYFNAMKGCVLKFIEENNVVVDCLLAEKTENSFELLSLRLVEHRHKGSFFAIGAGTSKIGIGQCMFRGDYTEPDKVVKGLKKLLKTVRKENKEKETEASKQTSDTSSTSKKRKEK